MRLKIKKKKVFRLQLLKSNFYRTTKKTIEQFKIHFKKILLVVFEFYKNNKKIIFIGFSSIYRKYFKKLILKYLSTKNLVICNKYKKLKVKKKPDLIITVNPNLNVSFINEALILKIPTINLEKFNFIRKEKFKIYIILFFYFLFQFLRD